MAELTATVLMQRYKSLERLKPYIDNPTDPQELARKVCLFLGEDTDDAVMTFVEDGSTRDELVFRAISIILAT